MKTTERFAHADPQNQRRWARRLGPYAQDREGCWFTFNQQTGWVRLHSHESRRGIRHYQRIDLIDRLVQQKDAR